MRQSVDFNSSDFALRTRESPGRRETQDAERPFRVLVIGNFSGRAERAGKPLEIDPDNFDEVLEATGPEVNLALPGHYTLHRFRSLEDFHPDSLYSRLAGFDEPAKQEFLRAAQKAESPAPPAPPPAPVRTAPAAPPRAAANILEDMLAVQSGEAAAAPARTDLFDDVIQSIVKPHLERPPAAGAAEKAQLSDAYDSEVMRSILHQPAFQALEAAWRALDFFVRRVPTGGDIRLAILDLPLADLKAELRAGDGTLKRAFDGFGDHYALCVGLYEFGPEPEDLETLGRVADLAAAANIAFVTGGGPDLLGQTTFAGLEQARKPATPPGWSALRQRANSDRLGVALPRFLLRLPYGRKTSDIDSFDFTEMPGEPDHEHYLWGNSAIGAAVALAVAFEQGGWENLSSSIDPELEGLPVHTFGPAAGPRMTPCAETWMTDELAMLLIDEGFLAFASLRHRDAIRLLRVQSISKSAPQLRGPWS